MTNFSVKPILRTDKKRKDETYPICYRVTINKKTTKLSSGEFAEIAKWNKSEGRFKGSRTSIENCMLDATCSELRDFIRKEILLGNAITLEKVKKYFSGNKKTAFYAFLEDFFKLKFLELHKSTQKHYLLVEKRLKEFKPKISFDEIDLSFIVKFDKFLRKKGIGVDGLWQHHKILKVIIGYAIKKGYLQINPYDDFKVKKGKPKWGALTASEIKALAELKFDNKAREEGKEIIRDMFLFGCYTGLRFSDVCSLSKTDVINSEYIRVVTQKTGKKVEIPVLGGAVQLINKYNKGTSGKVFPTYTNQYCNRVLKELAQLSGIHDKTVTFHMSRHSFATNLVTANANPYTISLLMGHSSVRQTMIYVNADVEALREQMKNAKMFNQSF